MYFLQNRLWLMRITGEYEICRLEHTSYRRNRVAENIPFYDITNIIIRYHRTCWQADTHLENSLTYAIHVCRSILIYWLLMHRLPNRSCLNLLAQHEDTQCLHILIRLTASSRRIHHVNHTCSTTNSKSS